MYKESPFVIAALYTYIHTNSKIPFSLFLKKTQERETLISSDFSLPFQDISNLIVNVLENWKPNNKPLRAQYLYIIFFLKNYYPLMLFSLFIFFYIIGRKISTSFYYTQWKDFSSMYCWNLLKVTSRGLNGGTKLW